MFAHPQTGSPLDRSKVTKRFKAACRAAGVREVKFYDLRHTFATRLAASGQIKPRINICISMVFYALLMQNHTNKNVYNCM